MALLIAFVSLLLVSRSMFHGALDDLLRWLALRNGVEAPVKSELVRRVMACKDSREWALGYRTTRY